MTSHVFDANDELDGTMANMTAISCGWLERPNCGWNRKYACILVLTVLSESFSRALHGLDLFYI